MAAWGHSLLLSYAKSVVGPGSCSPSEAALTSAAAQQKHLSLARQQQVLG